jgi:hypothetical protein
MIGTIAVTCLKSFGPDFILPLVLADNIQGAAGVKQREGPTLIR